MLLLYIHAGSCVTLCWSCNALLQSCNALLQSREQTWCGVCQYTVKLHESTDLEAAPGLCSVTMLLCQSVALALLWQGIKVHKHILQIGGFPAGCPAKCAEAEPCL